MVLQPGFIEVLRYFWGPLQNLPTCKVVLQQPRTASAEVNLDDLEKRVKAMNDQAVRGFVFCDFDERMAVAKFDQNAVVQMPCGSHVTRAN